MKSSVRFSILDLAPIAQGATAGEALQNSLDLVRQAEAWGYHRYWVAEHHNIPGVASSATAVVLAHLAAGTRRIRLGSGGIMLPNHAPLVIAEQFGTLASLHPGRIDLGLGRAPGGDQATARALRRYLGSNGDTFPDDVRELQKYLGAPQSGQTVRAVPGQGTHVPIYLLGSSTFSAQLAADLGLPFAFASHFAPEYLSAALRIYRERFQPSAQLAEPYVMVGVNVFAADSDEEATRLFTTLQQLFLNLVRGHPREMPPPADQLNWDAYEEAHVRRMTRVSAIGGAAKVRAELAEILAETAADEIVATAHIFNHAARLRSFEILAGLMAEFSLTTPLAA